MPKISPTLAAIALYLAVNALVLQLAGGSAAARLPSSSFNERITRFRQCQESPDVVLLGSSVMRSPFFYLDCKRGQQIVLFEQFIEPREFEARLADVGTSAHAF